MAYRIAVMDDQAVYRETVAQLVQSGLKASPGDVHLFSNTASLMAQNSLEPYDAFFLDIALPGDNGIRLALELRKRGVTAPIVFVSGVESQVFESFQAQPLGFVRKANLNEDFSQVLPRLLEQLQERDSQRLLLQCDDGEMVVRVRDIQYIESANKRQLVYLMNQVLAVRHTMQYFEEHLPKDEFTQTHRCYYVNCRCISYISSSEVVLDSGHRLPVSRGRLTEVQTLFRRLNVP